MTPPNPRFHRSRLSASSIDVQPDSDSETAKRNISNSEVDLATAAFIRRTLCAHHVGDALDDGKGRKTPRPLDELLPPLTSSNEVDLQLYAIIAVILKEFVYTWYSKITPDHVFTDEVIQIIAHCTRALEQRLRKVDLETLILDEIPELLDAHVDAYRIAHHQASINPSLSGQQRQIYHTLCPHPALSPVPLELDPSTALEQYENEAAWRQLLVQGILAVLLPTEDLENACLRALVTEIFAELIVGNGIGHKACEGWLLWEVITKAIEAMRPRVVEDPIMEAKLEGSTSRLERFGLLSAEEEIPEPVKQEHRDGLNDSYATIFLVVVQYVFLVFSWIGTVVYALATASSLPGRNSITSSVRSQPASPNKHAREQKILTAENAIERRLSSSSPIDSMKPESSNDLNKAGATNTTETPSINRPILSMSVWRLVANLLELNTRMPWLSGLLSLIQWGCIAGPGRVGDTDGAMDRLLYHNLHTTLRSPRLVPQLLRLVREALFPGNALAPPRAVPDQDEQRRIKRRCADAILGALPGFVAGRYFQVSGEDRVAEVESLLDVLGDSYLNKHLMFGIVELLVVRLIPELGEEGVEGLLKLRLGDLDS